MDQNALSWGNSSAAWSRDWEWVSVKRNKGGWETGPSRDGSEKPGHVENWPAEQGCSRNEPGKASKEARTLRPGKLGNSKHVRRKGPAERRHSWAGKCLWSPLLTLMSQVLLAEWNELRKRKKPFSHLLTCIDPKCDPPTPNQRSLCLHSTFV